MDTQESVDRNMKKWSEAKDETQKAAILDTVREEVLHDLDQILNGATNNLAQQVERYSVLSLLGSLLVQVANAVRFLEQMYRGLEEKGESQDHLGRVEKSLGGMKRKLELLNVLERDRKESGG